MAGEQAAGPERGVQMPEQARCEMWRATHDKHHEVTDEESRRFIESIREAHRNEHEAHAQLHRDHADSHEKLHVARAEGDRRYLESILEAHAEMHLAHEKTHTEQHEATQKALARAEQTMRETAILHASAHEREHIQAQIAIDKAEQTYAARFENLNEAKARAQDERNTFATKEATDDKFSAVVGRLDAVDRTLVGLVERTNGVLANTARLEAIEREIAQDKGRDRGVMLAWSVAAGAIFLFIAIAGFLATRPAM